MTLTTNLVLPSRRGRGRPVREEAADRDEILRIAFEAFAREGFDGTNLRSIAAAAGVDVALLSRHFGPKMEFWKAVVDRLSALMQDGQAPIRDLHRHDAPIGERISTALHLFAAFNCEVPELARFFAEATRSPGERKDYVLRQLWQPYVETMRPLFHEATEADILIVGDLDLLLLMLIGATAMPVMLPNLAEPQPCEHLKLETKLGNMLVAMCLRSATAPGGGRFI